MTVERYSFAAVGNGRVALMRRDVPVPRSTEALIRVSASLVSTGTERHYIAMQRPGDDPLDLGYCAVGQVVAVGDAVGAVIPGDTVLCMGWGIAIHSNYALVPRRLLSPVPEAVPAQHAVLAALGATAIHAMDRADLGAGDRVLVVGLGPVGQLACLAAADRGCQVWAWDLDMRKAASEAFWTTLDLTRAKDSHAGRITKILLCVDADVTALFPLLLPLLSPDGNGRSRSKIVNVGRATGQWALAPSDGNFDIVNVSRCGAGYRCDAYHHGLMDLDPVRGEATVDVNLRRSVELVCRNRKRLDALAFNVLTPDEALMCYNREEFFPGGFNVLLHEQFAPRFF